MKHSKFIAVFCFFLFSFTLKTVSQTFKKVYNVGGQASYSLVQDAQSRYLIVGGTGINNQGKLSLNLLDNLGNSIWYRYGDYTGVLYSKIRAYTTSNGYVVIFPELVNAAQTRFCFLEIDFSGNVLQTLHYGRNNLVALNSTEIPGGGYYLFASIGDSILVMKLNSSGQQTWSKGYPATLDSNSLGFENSIIPAKDGGFFLYGHCSVSFNPPNSIFVLRADSSGSVTWAKRYSQPFPILDLIQTSDGGIVCVGGSITLDPRIFKLDGNGQFLWGYELDAPNEHHRLAKIREDSFGNLQVAGAGGQSLTHLGVIIHTFDAMGILDYSNVVYWQFDDLSDFILTNDGGSATLSLHPAIGAFGTYGNYLIKCDQNNKTGCYDASLNFFANPFALSDTMFPLADSNNSLTLTTTPYVLTDTFPNTLILCEHLTSDSEISRSTGITISPNPCSDCLLKITGLENGNYNYKIIAMNGRILESGILNTNELRINNSLPSGCYILEVSDGISMLHQRLLIGESE